ncbi:MAG TPA: glycosyltransferase family 2 protein [Methylotenera sp.]
MTIKLSICIATYKRAAFIGETLNSILGQMEPGVEIVVVDGASPDNTPEIMTEYSQRYDSVRYFREEVNSGVDADFDKAVGYAQGKYCWLMTDDDLLKTGAIARVLAELGGGEEDLVVVNAEVRNVDLSKVVEERRLKFDTDHTYRAGDRERMFIDTAGYLSFIGCVVIRRSCWLERDRSSYYGTLFIHVGVIFQNPALANVKAIATPLITIRYGNAMWTPRSYEIWMFKWPELVWSFPDFSDAAKRKVYLKEPWCSAKALFKNRALGAYTSAEFHQFWPADVGGLKRTMAYFLSIFPASLANVVMVIYFTLIGPNPLTVQDLLSSRNSNCLSRFVARLCGVIGA